MRLQVTLYLVPTMIEAAEKGSFYFFAYKYSREKVGVRLQITHSINSQLQIWLPLSIFLHLNSLFNRRSLLTKYPKLRSQSFIGDEGKSADVVDASLSVLRERIEEVKKKERIWMSDTSRFLQHGWSYTSGFDDRYRHKRSNILFDSFQHVGFASYLLGLVFLSGSLGICLVSFLVHLNKMN